MRVIVKSCPEHIIPLFFFLKESLSQCIDIAIFLKYGHDFPGMDLRETNLPLIFKITDYIALFHIILNCLKIFLVKERISIFLTQINK